MEPGLAFPMVVVTIAIVLIFDFTNGFNDAGNIIGTPIASRAMAPMHALLLVAFLEFIGPMLAGTSVANTIGKFVDLSGMAGSISTSIIMSGIIGAICWNIVTWWLGIPSSSSHALVGGLAGAVIIAAGTEHVVWGFKELVVQHKFTGITKVILSLILAPVVSFLAGFIIHRFVGLILLPAKPIMNKYLKNLQWFTTGVLAFAHGANDAQKSMGVITLVLFLGGVIPEFKVPFWVIVTCGSFITMGIIAGGWRIVKTVGFGIYKLTPVHAFDTQFTAATVILTASLVGSPVSTSHVVNSGIMGIGSSEWPRRVRWAKAKEIVSTWIVTIPSAGLMAGLIYQVVSLIVQGVMLIHA